MKYKYLSLLLLFLGFQCLANDAAIYANGDGTYTYFGQTYSFDEFPMREVAAVENKVQIFPLESLTVEQSLVSVRPLARKFIKHGYEVETRLYGKVIPYMVQKRGE